MLGWNHEEVKDRYLNHLRPGLTHDYWTVEEDLVLIELYNSRGEDWEEAQRLLPGRNLSQI